MTTEITVPILPCRSINEMLEFYRALGFEVTYQQAKPNIYAVVRRGGIELHFFSMREFVPANSYSSCYVRASDVDGLYQAFGDGLRQKYGRVPSAFAPVWRSRSATSSSRASCWPTFGGSRYKMTIALRSATS